VPQVHAPGMEAEVDRWRHLPASLRAEEPRSSQPPAVAHAAPPQRPGQPNCLHHRDPRLADRQRRPPTRQSAAPSPTSAALPRFAESASLSGRVYPNEKRRGPPLAQDLFKLELFLELSRLFVVTAGALALAGNLLLGLRGARVQLLGAGGLLLGGRGALGGFPAQSLGLRAQFLSSGGMGVCLLTVSGGL
jgi:hypothetical protein